MQDLGKGDKYSPSEPITDGLSERSPFDSSKDLRGETSEATQRPTSKTKSVSSDRGAFKDKC